MDKMDKIGPDEIKKELVETQVILNLEP